MGVLADLGSIEAAAVTLLRRWCDREREEILTEFEASLGAEGAKAVAAFQEILSLCSQHGRRPLMRHDATCACVGSDEAWFANFIGAASEGAREEALLIATVIVRADMAPLLAAYAEHVGLSLRRMALLRDRPANQMKYH